jgi:hypothetical protein
MRAQQVAVDSADPPDQLAELVLDQPRLDQRVVQQPDVLGVQPDEGPHRPAERQRVDDGQPQLPRRYRRQHPADGTENHVGVPRIAAGGAHDQVGRRGEREQRRHGDPLAHRPGPAPGSTWRLPAPDASVAPVVRAHASSISALGRSRSAFAEKTVQHVEKRPYPRGPRTAFRPRPR